jgi:hypothetical protein
MSQPLPRPAKKDPKLKPAEVAQLPGGEEEEGEEGSRFLLFNVMPSWMVSFMTPIAGIIVLAIMVMPTKTERTVALEAGEQAAEALESIDLNLDAIEFDSEDPFETEISEEEPTEVTETMEVSLPEAEVDFGNIMGAEEAFDAEMGELNPSDMTEETGSRTGDSKERLKKKFGATGASEEAVALALKWIIKHQLPDGGWSLDHTKGPGNFRDSPDPGTIDARNAATALAILPLLGAGNTHQTGDYKQEVRYGLEYLMKNAKRSARGISYLEPGGSMYSHGLVSIVFCEAYAMTKDSQLAPFAQGTVWFIEDAQDPVGGGWRYQPREPGDTSAVGWQMMALKSGKITGLNINPRTYQRAEKFLDSVSSHYGAFYGYTNPPGGKPADARTAIGLLCRMYMGWDKNTPGLIDGMGAISEKGPSTGARANMYYNYYATQAVKHMGGRQWKEWNAPMRDFLVKSQSKDGNAAGSWHFPGGHASDKGGRLYTTSMACMTLEVYYRYLPLYGDKAANDDFPLE